MFKSRKVFSIFNMWWKSIPYLWSYNSQTLFTKFTWLALLTFIFRFCWLQTGLSDNLTWKCLTLNMDLIDVGFWKFHKSVFNLCIALLICLNFPKDQRRWLYSHFGGTGVLFFASFWPFVMTFGYRNAIPEDNSWNWSR